MTLDLSRTGFELASIAVSASSGASPDQRILKLLADLGNADAAMLTRHLPHSGTYEIVAGFGYAPDLVHHVASGEYTTTDPGYRSIMTDVGRRKPRHWGNLAVDYSRSFAAREFLLPVGFRNGVSARLETSDGHYLGDFFMSTRDSSTPSSHLLDLLTADHPLIAEIQEIAGVRSIHQGSDTITLVRYDGSVRILHLGSAPGVSRIPAGALDSSRRTRSFAHELRGWIQRSDRSWIRLSADPGRSGVIVSTSAQDPPFRMTRRELEILSGCCDGLTNVSIARRLGISERTVAHTIQKIYVKLGVTSRAAAVTMAVRENLRMVDPDLVQIAQVA